MGKAYIYRNGERVEILLVIFDMDGTLTESNLDFNAIRKEANIPPGSPLLEYLEGMSPERKSGVLSVLNRHELEDARSCKLKDGAERVLELLKEHKLKVAVLTRNSRLCSRLIMERFSLPVDFVVSREDAPPKPSAEPVLKICRELGVPPEHTIIVGDYIFDIQAGRNAGTLTALVENKKVVPSSCSPDFHLRQLPDLIRVLNLHSFQGEKT